MSGRRHFVTEKFVFSDVAISNELRIEKAHDEKWELAMILSCVTTAHVTGPDTIGTIFFKKKILNS